MDYYDAMSARFNKEKMLPAIADSVYEDNAINSYIFNNYCI